MGNGNLEKRYELQGTLKQCARETKVSVIPRKSMGEGKTMSHPQTKPLKLHPCERPLTAHHP